MTVFETLNGLNVNEHTEKKKVDGEKELTYLSWPWAWAEVKKRYPDAHYEIKRGKNGLPYVCDPFTGYMVFTSVTIEGITHDMWLPVMDGANNAMKQTEYKYYVKNPNHKYAREADDGEFYDKYGNKQPEFFEKKVKAATMFDVNKTIMRCLVKNLAMFGLGLYIYAGEDLPEGEEIKPEPLPADALQPGEKMNLPPAGSWNPRNAIGLFCKRVGLKMTDFANLRTALIAGGIVKDIPSGELSPVDFDVLCKAMEANYPELLKVSA